MTSIHGKNALVTGAAKRVGRAIALELAQAGCNVAVHYRGSAREANALAAEIVAMGRQAGAFQADLGVGGASDRLYEEVVSTLGQVDILVNNASTFEQASLTDLTEGQWTATLQTNAITPAMLARRAGLAMADRGWGRIINLGDVLVERPPRGLSAYCASKAALECITRSLARELAPHVTVNTVAPGIAVFPEQYDQSLRDKLVARVPLQRAGTPEEVARLVRFLCEAGEYITGQKLAIDGGRSVVP